MPPPRHSPNEHHPANNFNDFEETRRVGTLSPRTSPPYVTISQQPLSLSDEPGPNLTLSHYSSRTTGQEYSNLNPFDPHEDVLQAQQMLENRKKLKYHQIFRYATCLDWLLMVVGIVLAILSSFITPYLYHWVGFLIHDMAVYERCLPTKDPQNGNCSVPGYCNRTVVEVGRYFLFHILSAWFIHILSQFLYCVCFTVAADRQTKKMRIAYFESTLRKDIAWFDIYTDRDFAKATTEEVTHIRLGIGDVIPTIVNLIFTVIVMIITVLLLDPKATGAYIAFVPLSILIVHIGNTAEVKRSSFADDNFEEAHRMAREDLVNIKMIKMYQGENIQLERFGNALNSAKNGKGEVKWMCIAAASSGAIWLVLNVGTAIIFLIGKGAEYKHHDQFCTSPQTLQRDSFFMKLRYFNINKATFIPDGPGEMILVYFGLLYISLRVVQLASLLSSMQIALLNATGVFFVIDWKTRIDNLSMEGKVPKRAAIGRIDFKHVTFRYPRKPDDIVLDIPILTIFSGQFVVFSGPERSGKSTIIKLIPRLYDVCSGFISLDAVNLQNYNINWLRQQIGLICEKPIIFTGTIYENIRFGKLSASSADIVWACQEANIRDAIEKLPKGYDTIISNKEYGDHLSWTEKRQLCLARAYLHRARIVLLDNPLSPEGDELDQLLLKYVNFVRDTSTVIMASNTVNALSKRADCIYYMEGGHIIEHGNHIQLIQAKGKYYSRLEETINCSLESKKRLHSQLKAYKVNQRLQLQKISFEVTEPTSDSDHRNASNVIAHFLKLMQLGSDASVASQGSRGSSSQRNTFEAHNDTDNSHRVGSFISHGNAASMQHISTKPGDPAAPGNGDDPGLHVEVKDERMSETERQSQLSHMQHLQQQQFQAMAAARLEEAYHRYSDGNRKSVDRFMHQGFGLMGFQRMNFARPMTNYSTQIRKHRNTFFTIFDSYRKQVSKRKGHGGLDLSTMTADFDYLFKGNDSRESFHGTGSSEMHTSERTSRVKFSMVKETRNISPTPDGDKTQPKLSQATNVLKSIRKSRTGIVESEPNPLLHRQSFMDALKKMTAQPGAGQSFNEDMPDLVATSHEVDDIMAEYDEGIYSTVQTKVIGFWRDLYLVTKHDWGFIIPGFLGSICLGISIPCQTYVVASFFQTLSTNYPTEAELRKTVLKLSVHLILIGILTAVAAFIQEFCFGMASKNMTRKLRQRLFGHILAQDLSWFDEKEHDIGILTYHIYADTTIVHYVLLVSYGIVTQAASNFGASMIFALYALSKENFPIVTVSLMVLMPFLIYIVFYSSKRELTESMNLDRKFKPACDFTQEFFQNLATWVALGAEPHFISRHRQLLDKQYKSITRSVIWTTFLHSVLQTSSWLLCAVFVFITLTHHYISNPPAGTFSLVGFILITSELLIFGAYRIGDQLVILADTNTGKSAAHKIKRILVSEPEIDSLLNKPSQLANFDDDNDPPEILVKNVCYQYPGKDDEDPIDGITLNIPSYSYVAIVGPPGSGKSTFCNLLLRMCDPCLGAIEFNGKNAQSINPRSIRKLMSLVEYDPCLFQNSIEDNIRFGSRYPSKTPRSEILEAAKLALCHFDILDIPGDYSANLSLLEMTEHVFAIKQRISYARAIVRNPKILIIDDATTSVDFESDSKLLQVIANVREGRTLIVFSHKIEPIRDADMIYVLWDGQIVEHGEDAELIGYQGHYYEMYMTQKVLAESMRNSPHQLNTIRYNMPEVPDKRSSVASTSSPRKTSAAYVKFLNEKMSRIKKEKLKRMNELELEVSELEKEQKERESRNVFGKRHLRLGEPS